MKRLLTLSLIFAGIFPNCVSWNDHYGPDTQRFEDSAPADELIAIPTGNKDSYYMVDQKRGLCFLEEGQTLTAIDCNSVRGAAHLLGKKPKSPNQAERVPNPIKRPATKQEKRPSEATPEEVEAFTNAYTEIVCQSRLGAEFSPHESIAKHGLTALRYTQIEGLLARQKKRWLALTRDARNKCAKPTEPPTQPGNTGTDN